MKKNLSTLILLWMACASAFAAKQPLSHSVYTLRPDDPEAIYFTPENYGFKADGKSDVTAALQQAINDVKTKYAFGILYLPEGEYRITKTITIPPNVRLIGFGKKRPVFYLADNTPGYQNERNYMIWFTGGLAREGMQPSDANAGTFYSALSNVDFRIGKGNPQAVAIRSHFAQHSFLNHIDFQMAPDALAGIWDLGNEVEDLRFYGGQYGIISSRPSPSWPVMVVDTYFEGQKKAAVLGKDLGAAFVGMHVKNVPIAYESADNTRDIVYIEKALFENISDAAVKIAVEGIPTNLINLQDITCSNVPVAVYYKPSQKAVVGKGKAYNIKTFTYGITYDSADAVPAIRETAEINPVVKAPMSLEKDLRSLPGMETWVSVKKYGAKGDGVTDDTEAFEKAIAANEVIYVPTGWYRLTRTLKLGPKTKLIGLHTYATQFVLSESEPAFSGFGGPVPMIESFPGGDNIFNGIGIFTGAYNYRAVGLKWQSSAESFLNDVKFVGGHGTLRKPVLVDPNATPRVGNISGRGFSRIPSSPSAPVYVQGKDQAWDNQYWSLWITNGGGGTIKDVWSANTYAAAGVYISETQTPGRIYCMSLEHHVRSEARMTNVANWKIYCLQFEEEGTEGPDCLNMEMSGCRDITFANLWMYRVIRVQTPKHWGFRIWDSKDIIVNNMSSYTQIVPILETPIYDVNKDIPVPTWNIVRLNLTGSEPTRREQPGLFRPVKLADGFELAAGATADSKGNVFFSEHRQKKVYKWNADSGHLTFVADFPFKPLALATDTQDNLLAIVRYDPQPGLMVDGKQETVPVLADDNPDYSGWGNSGWTVRVWSINPDKGESSFTSLPLVKSSSLSGIQRVWHPGSRRRPDFQKIAENMPENSYLATDGKTAIPETFDLFRCSAVFPVTPGQSQEVYVADELNRTTVAFSVNADGTLKQKGIFAPFSQYCIISDAEGNVYIADGDIVIFDRDGEPLRRIHMEDRPISLAIGGKNKEMLLITTSRGFYVARIK
ncbi:MAG: glycosyl hydrolase family 28-related protein [Bacteroidota bacterium]|jgi:hypothetical protein|nr:glycosyl hydrolase family 28-related protein [Bacteroidota bacterium]